MSFESEAGFHGDADMSDNQGHLDGSTGCPNFKLNREEEHDLLQIVMEAARSSSLKMPSAGPGDPIEVSTDMVRARATIANIIYFEIILSPAMDIYFKYIKLLEEYVPPNADCQNEKAQLIYSLRCLRDTTTITDEDEIKKITERVMYLISGLRHESRVDSPTSSAPKPD